MTKTLIVTVMTIVSQAASAELFHYDPAYLPRGTFTEILEISCATTQKYLDKYGEASPQLAAPGNGSEGGQMDTPNARKILVAAHPGLAGGVAAITQSLEPVATTVRKKRADALREYLRSPEYTKALNTCAGLDNLYPAKLSLEDSLLRHLVNEEEKKNLSDGRLRRKRSAIFERALERELITCQDLETGTPITIWHLLAITDSCTHVYRALTRP